MAIAMPARPNSRVRWSSPKRRGNVRIVEDAETKAQTYAWSWFALHAGQRLQLVNFWLVAVAFLVSAYVQARSNHMPVIAFGVSVAGIVSSVAFMRLDVRTRQLVQVAENALRHFEASGVAAGMDQVAELVRASREARRSPFDSYRKIIQGLQLSVACMFVLAAAFAWIST